MKRGIKRPTVRVKAHDYQTGKAEIEEFFHLPTTPEALAKVVPGKVQVIEDPNA